MPRAPKSKARFWPRASSACAFCWWASKPRSGRSLAATSHRGLPIEIVNADRRDHHERFAFAGVSPQEGKLGACGRASGARRQSRSPRQRRQYRRGDDRRALCARHAAFGRPSGACRRLSQHEGKSHRHSGRGRERGFQARADRAIRRDGRDLLPHDLGNEAPARRAAFHRRRRNEGQRADARGRRSPEADCR